MMIHFFKAQHYCIGLQLYRTTPGGKCSSRDVEEVTQTQLSQSVVLYSTFIQSLTPCKIVIKINAEINTAMEEVSLPCRVIQKNCEILTNSSE